MSRPPAISTGRPPASPTTAASSGRRSEEMQTPRQDKGKGKARADSQDGSLPCQNFGSPRDDPITIALDEALNDDLPRFSPSPSVDSHYTPISPPPLAHRHPVALGGPGRPKLLSQITRSTLPVSSLSYAEARVGDPSPRRAMYGGLPKLGESSTSPSPPTSRSRRIASAPHSQPDVDAFPDLDPTTGLPLSFRRDSSSSDAPSLHLQRTITDLLARPAPNPASTTSRYLPSMSLPSITALPALPTLPNMNMPSLPGLPFSRSRRSNGSRSSLDLARMDSRRSVSSSAPQEDWSSWASGWWGGNKSKVDRTLSEDDQADTVEEEREKHRRKYRTPKNPLVFCHGLLGFDYIGPAGIPPYVPKIAHWRGIREVLESNGAEVMIARVPATASIKDRAAILAEAIGEKFPGRKVNLVGHSMGGLDCRYLVSEIDPTSFKPVSLTTISTPHRGSPFADYVIDNVIGRDRLPSLLSLMESLRLPQSGDGSAFNALGTRSMKEFNSLVLDREDVSYYSWGASFDPGLLDTFRWPHSVILAKEGPNDGLVSVHSARWGEYRGTLVGVNHLDLVGWVNTVRYAIAGWTGAPIMFKPATFYLEVADYLAEQGF